ncbi:MAG TPA: hypothetical protein VMT96_00550 [Candidatus Bathyarchaeia archaeon]|nr:hypothetical protein [Candidatus Bathyarchaeia archaeon]
MSKKKRDRKHKSHAQVDRPTIVKVSAVRRNKVHQWWVDHKQMVRQLAPVAGIVLVVLLVIIGLISIIWPR